MQHFFVCQLHCLNEEIADVCVMTRQQMYHITFVYFFNEDISEPDDDLLASVPKWNSSFSLASCTKLTRLNIAPKKCPPERGEIL